MSAVPSRIVIDIPAAEQVRLRKQLRAARWGGWLTLPILLLLAQQRSPSAIADWLLCSRSTVYATAWDWLPVPLWLTLVDPDSDGAELARLVRVWGARRVRPASGNYGARRATGRDRRSLPIVRGL